MHCERKEPEENERLCNKERVGIRSRDGTGGATGTIGGARGEKLETSMLMKGCGGKSCKRGK